MPGGIGGPRVRAGVTACVALCSSLLVVQDAPANAAAEACSPPAAMPPVAPTPVERADAHAPVDYHLLVLTWAPVFIARHASPGACVPAAPFVAGGLIPRSRSAVREDDQPGHCIPSMPLSSATVRRHFALMPDPQFMQDSWVRYGGCAFANAWEYFDRLTELHTRLRQPDLMRLASRGTITAGAIRAAFVAANTGLGLAPEHLAVAGHPAGRLDNVAVCYDVRFRLTPCPRPGLPDRTRLRLTGRRPSERGTPRRHTRSTEEAPPSTLTSIRSPSERKRPEVLMSLVDFKWYALQVRPKWEQRVARVLSLKGYTVFAPIFTIKKSGRTRGSDTTAPIFPAYVLCRYEASIAHRMVDSPGVIRLVGYGHTPSPVDDVEMVSLQLLYASGAPSYPWQYYRSGQRIRVISGALAGVEGYFVRLKGSDRVIVNLTILQRSIMVEFDGGTVEALPASAEPTVVAQAWRARIRPEVALDVA